MAIQVLISLAIMLILVSGTTSLIISSNSVYVDASTESETDVSNQPKHDTDGDATSDDLDTDDDNDNVPDHQDEDDDNDKVPDQDDNDDDNDKLPDDTDTDDDNDNLPDNQDIDDDNDGIPDDQDIDEGRILGDEEYCESLIKSVREGLAKITERLREIYARRENMTDEERQEAQTLTINLQDYSVYINQLIRYYEGSGYAASLTFGAFIKGHCRSVV